MKRKILLLIISLVLSIVFMFGLTSDIDEYPDLKENAIAFNMGEYIDKNDDDAGYGTIIYNGRTYMPYGTLKRGIKSKNIKECIGYIIQNENSSSIVDENNKDTRVYTLIEDPNENYLMIYYIGTTLMNQPAFWKAIDTKDRKVDTPNYIVSLDYGYWK